MNAAHHHHHPKLSRNQSEILSCLRKAKEPMSAYAILDRVRTSGISHPPTVYRALNELMQKGMVHRLQSRSAFIACGHGACDGKFAFAICRQCEKVVEIPLSDEDQATLLGLAPDEIAPEQVTLEIAGLCQACRRPDASEQRKSKCGGKHRHVALVAKRAGGARSGKRIRSLRRISGERHLAARLSVPARLVMVAVASSLLWGAVAWALA